MSSLKIKFGKRVRELRKSKGLTQEQVAEFINIEPPNFSKLENGLHFPQPDKIERLAIVLDVEIYELFECAHKQNKNDIINYLKEELDTFDINSLELIYKFVNNLKLYK